MMGYKSGNSFEMMANNKYSQTKIHNQNTALVDNSQFQHHPLKRFVK